MSVKMAELLFPEVKERPEDIEKRFPKRELAPGARVTRLGPSPTGFIHLGNLYGAFVDERLAHQSEGLLAYEIIGYASQSTRNKTRTGNKSH